MKKGLKKKNKLLSVYQKALAVCGVFFCTVFGSAMPAFAMNGNADPVTYINNFYTIICSVITASVPLYCCGQSYSLQLR